MNNKKHGQTYTGSFDCLCSSKIGYNEKYDARYCYNSKEWIEDICDDPKCYYCNKRPKKASFK